MPRELLNIPLDEIGVITNAEARDVADSAVVIKVSDTKEVYKRTKDYSVANINVDPMSPKGRIQPIKAPANLGISFEIESGNYDIVTNEWIYKQDDTYTLVFDDGNDIKYIEDFYAPGNKTPVTIAPNTDMKCVSRFNQMLSIGTGKSTLPIGIGYSNHNIFGGIFNAIDTVNNFTYGQFYGYYNGDINTFYIVEIYNSGGTKIKYKIGNGDWILLGDANGNTIYELAYGVKFRVISPVVGLYRANVYAFGKTIYKRNNKFDFSYFAGLIETTFSNYSLPTDWEEGKTYKLYYNITIDNYQESELYHLRDITPTNNNQMLSIKFKISHNAILNYSWNFNDYLFRYATRINIYVKNNDNAAVLLASIILNGTTFPGDNSQSFNNKECYDFYDSQTGQYYKTVLFSITKIEGAKYKDLTGRDDDLRYCYLQYALSTRTDNYNFVADAWHPILNEDAGNILFRSDFNMPDIFNWSTNILPLPFKPKQLASYKNKVFVFGDNQILKIDAFNLSIEETFNGIGIANVKPLVIDNGIYWYDYNSIYHYDGKVILDIGYAIRTSTNSNILSFANTLGLNVPGFIVYSGEKRCILFGYRKPEDYYVNIWAWSLEKLEWYCFRMFSSSGSMLLKNMFTGKTSEVYIFCYDLDTQSNTMYKLFSSNIYEAITFITKKYDLGLSEQDKKWYKIKFNKTAGVFIYYGYNDSEPNTYYISGYLGNPALKAKNIQLKIVTQRTTTFNYIDVLEIIYRVLIGIR